MFALHMKEDGQFTQWPIAEVNENPTTGIVEHYTMPGVRDPRERVSGAAYNGILYAAWYQPPAPTVTGFPSMIKLRQLFDDVPPGSGITRGSLFTFDGSNPSAMWNCPYRLDVCVGNGSSTTVGVSFIAGYVSGGSFVQANRDILTITNSGLVDWYDTRLSQSHPNWQWDSQGRLEWYRSQIDVSSNVIYDTWVEDGLLDINNSVHDNQVFFNYISP